MAAEEKKRKQIVEIKALLKNVITVLFGAVDSAQMTQMLLRAAGSAAVRLAMKEIRTTVLKFIAEAIAKISAKQVAKFGAKSFVKKVPVIGLGAGIIFGACRLISGDPGRAALEVTSGAAATFAPGPGTAASVGVDATIAAIDTAEALKIYRKREASFQQYAKQLEELQSELDKLQTSYKILKRAYDEFDFEDDAKALIEAINYINYQLQK